MRDRYLELPEGSLSTAGSVLVDWNISTRIEHLHRRQVAGTPINTTTPEMARLRNLADSIPEDAVLITGLSAAESEVRRFQRAADSARYSSRADAAAFYLSAGRSYLRHLLAGGASGGLVIESAKEQAASTPLEPLRRWIIVPYAALLKVVAIDRFSTGTPAEKFEEFRFFLERTLKVSPSREGWIGFLLLAGTDVHRGRARRLLKLDGAGDVRDSVWGAAWDLMYTRMPTMVHNSLFRGHVRLPLTFVTDDLALTEVMRSLTPWRPLRNETGTELSSDVVDMDAILPQVAPLVREYMDRERLRVMWHSRGLTDAVIYRGSYEAAKLERLLADRSE